MGRLFFLLVTSLLYPAEVAIALDSDRDHPAIVDAQDIAPDTIRFRGWATRDEFYDRCHQADLKYKDANGSTTRDVMNPEDLNPMETLEEHLHARKDTEMGEPEVP